MGMDNPRLGNPALKFMPSQNVFFIAMQDAIRDLLSLSVLLAAVLQQQWHYSAGQQYY